MIEPLHLGRAERFVYLPVLGAILAVWTVSITLTLTERRVLLDRATSQLSATVVTLADFNELAEQASGDSGLSSSEQRAGAIWRALLQYPSLSIWLERDALVTDGQPPDGDLDASIVVREDRKAFSVLAALPKDDVLVDWQKSLWRWAGVLVAASVAFLLLTRFLVRALRQRAAAERAVSVERERAVQLEAHKAVLEQTVQARTQQLRDTNDRLQNELVERRVAETNLKEHDALLHAVAKSAAELLGTPNHEEAIPVVLELIGQTVGVSRVQLNEITTDRDGHLRSTVRHEWCAPGSEAMIDSPLLQNLDLTVALPRTVALLPFGGLSTFFVDEITERLRKPFAASGMRSFLQIPVLVEGKLWGSFDFVDSSDLRREWTWAESDTLQTLAGLIGASITRARYVKELADANMIVQNSPTILYRVRGEPPFPLIYVSHNIGKFGHEANALVGTSTWMDLLMEPEDQSRVAAAMLRTLERDAEGAAIEFRLRTGEGSYRWVENRYTPVRDKQKRLVEIEGIIIDVTERKAAEEKIAQLARTDGLTGLANRTTFIERMRQAFAASRRGATPFAILYLDLDHFKRINDTLGHPVGDQLLRETADRLRECTRENDIVARLGGDEFAILQTDMAEPAAAGALATAIQQSLKKPYHIDGSELRITVSIGISPYTASSTDPEAMVAQADLALYRSKEEGRNRFRFHSDELDHQVLERVTLAEELRGAIDKNEIEIYYQPQVELSSGRIVGMEALVRWHHPERGLLPAATFIDIAEKTGTIIPLGRWVLTQVCRRMRAWRDEGLALDVVTMNLSLAQLRNSAELIRDVAAALDEFWLAPADLSFDVTEATLAQLTLVHNDVISELRRLGVGIAIDDFGSAYSSFDYLRTYRVSYLKITQAFIDAAADDAERAATVRAILSLARELGIGVITEGVETEEQRGLSSQTVTFAQGIYFSDALRADEAHELLKLGRIEAGTKTRAHRPPTAGPEAETNSDTFVASASRADKNDNRSNSERDRDLNAPPQNGASGVAARRRRRK
jgi:diguanylate cyclase (GGDEF)-like protein/PAS domain S-box-containing protein